MSPMVYCKDRSLSHQAFDSLKTVSNGTASFVTMLVSNALSRPRFSTRQNNCTFDSMLAQFIN